MENLQQIAQLMQLTQGQNPLEMLGGLMQLITGLDQRQYAAQEAQQRGELHQANLGNMEFQRGQATAEAGRADRRLGLEQEQLGLAKLARADEQAYRQSAMTMQGKQLGLQQQQLDRSNQALQLQEQNVEDDALYQLANITAQSAMTNPSSGKLLGAITEYMAARQGITIPQPPPDPRASYIQQNIPGFGPAGAGFGGY